MQKSVCRKNLQGTGIAQYSNSNLSLKELIITAADANIDFFFSEKTHHDISCESSAWRNQTPKSEEI